MERLINVDKINYHEHTECMGHGDFEMVRTVTDKEIAEIPTVDSVHVRRGKWELSKKYVGYCSCSLCGDCYVEPEWVDRLHWRFCPNCGAKMDGGSDG